MPTRRNLYAFAYAMNKIGDGRTGDIRAFAPILAAWEALTRA